MLNKLSVFVVVPCILLLSILFALPCRAAEVVIVADTGLRPVAEIIAGIRKTLKVPVKIYAPADVVARLATIVAREDAKVVVALGQRGLTEALQLPPEIPVIFDLVVTPPAINRPNTTGFYLATPVREYADLIRTHLHSIKQMAVVGSREKINLLAWGEQQYSCSSYSVKDSVEFVNTVKHLDAADAILLLPDTSVLTSAAMNDAYLYSFRKGIPLLGISERNVREGALVALVVDMVNVGRMIGDYAAKAINGANIGQVPPSPPRKFDLYLNTATASRMGIHIPGEMVRMAKRVYP